MKRALIFPIRKKWVDMIFNGTKKYEFRTKLPKHLVKGMKIYFYEALGKKKHIDKWEQYPEYICWRNDNGQGKMMDYITEGTGKICGEATVGEIYVNTKSGASYLMPKQKHILARMFKVTWDCQGFTDHKFAIELTNVIKYDGQWLGDKLTDEDFYNNISDNYHTNLENAPTSPIAKEEFVSWNKAKNEKRRLLKTNPKWTYMDYKEYPLCNVSYPPQAPIYVVEREEK